MNRRLAALVATATLLLAACSFGEAKPKFETLSDYYQQTVKWSDCDAFECAEVAVPLDYADLGQGTVLLSVMRHSAKAAKGTIFMNPGGPGGSGLDYLAAYETQFTPRVIRNYDLVAWDPRGVGKSAPIDCLTDSELDKYLAIDGTPDTPDEVTALAQSARELHDGCVRESGAILSHVSTMETVRDLDILRATVGEDRLNYLGKSYGTVIGAVYAHLFPERVGRLVLDGAVDVGLTSDELALGQAFGFDTALRRFAWYCVRVSDACSFAKTEQGVVDFIVKLLADLDRQPMKTLDGKRPLVESLAWTAIVGPMYIPDGGWDWLIEALGLAADGDGSMLLDISDWYNNRDLDGNYLDNSAEAFTAISCVDEGPEAISPEQLEPQFTAAAPITGRLLAWGQLMCTGWPQPATPLTEDVSAPTAAPILVIGTTYDPATPDAWARSLAAQLKVGVYLNYNGDGHTAYMSGSKSLDSAVDQFFLAGTVPPAGTSFEPDRPILGRGGEPA